MLDLLVKNGLTYVDGVFKKCDVGVKDGKIACVAECGILGEAKRVIEAEGKYVIPGGIDTMFTSAAQDMMTGRTFTPAP